MIACLFSGGKDSTLAIHKYVKNGKDVDLLITMDSRNEYSYMFHKPNIEFTKLQAAALGIKQIFAHTEGEKERELDDLEKIITKNNVTEIITGATASMYQKKRIDDICNKLAIAHVSPLWHIEPVTELQEIASDFNAIITQVSAEGFDESFLGVQITSELIERLINLNMKYKINLTFEGGEAETFVLDAPLFKKRIKVKKFRKEWKGGVGKYIIDEAELTDK